MAYDCWRGMVGIVKPTKGSGSLVELIKLLPDGIGVIPASTTSAMEKSKNFGRQSRPTKKKSRSWRKTESI